MTKANIITVIGAFLAALTVMFSGLSQLATKSDLADAMEFAQKLSKRLDQEITRDKIKDLNQMIFELKKKHHEEGEVMNWSDQEDQEQYRWAVQELELLTEEYKANLRVVPEEGDSE